MPLSGAVYPAETFVPFEALTIESDPAYCANSGNPNYRRPWQLEFCTEPTPCAGIGNAPLECLSKPERYYVLPFGKSFRWNSPPNEPGLEHNIGNVRVDVQICQGCGSSFSN